MIPARRVLLDATSRNERLGHENLGFLSEAHGFLPREPPLTSLPSTHAPWDEVAGRLPELFRNVTVRRVVADMPLLPGGEVDLADRYLLRASMILSILAHAYHYAEPQPPDRIPTSVSRPWEQVSRRLQRPVPHLSFTDLNAYNWRLLHDRGPDSIRVENLALLVPIVGNEDERRFQMTPVEMQARMTPVVGGVVRAQEAAAADDSRTLKRELLLIADTLKEVTYRSFPKVNPNAYSRLYVNPVVWGKTVAPLATPYDPDIPGPSGTAIPCFQLLDAFFGRHAYTSGVGRETARVRPWLPPHWRRFIDAAGSISVAAHVDRHGTSVLRGAFHEALESYAGDTGLLGRHRLKTYGFLDLSFKTGRTKTLGGFSGGFADRLWDRTDAELEQARRERYPNQPQPWQHVVVKDVRPLRDDPESWVGHVVLDLDGTGIRYTPGSRCAVLPEHGDEIVAHTLRSLRADGDEPVALDAGWREAVCWRQGYRGARVVSLRSLLRFGRIRPVDRAVAKLLYALSQDNALREIIERRAEDQWELWALLDLLAGRGFNPKRLWQAPAGDRDNICRVVRPEAPRMYSISSIMDRAAAGNGEEMHLTVSRLQYRSEATDVPGSATQRGTASSFLTCPDPPPGRRVAMRVVRPPRFSLPADPQRPIVMFAGGTGLAPFRALLMERCRDEQTGENWLFFGTRTRADLYYESELSRLAAQGRLHLRVAFSRDDVALGSPTGSHGGRFVLEPARRHHIGEEMLLDSNARALWGLLGDPSEGGAGAYLYVCGRAGFAKAVMAAIEEILFRFATGTETERRDGARAVVRRLVGEDRYMQEIYSTYTGPHFKKTRSFDASELVVRNNARDGYWMAISGRVYDLSEFAHLHPGGHQIIRSYAGMDATTAYEKVLHDVNPEVDAMLGMFEVGVVRRLDFGSAWGVAVGPGGLRFAPLKDVYRSWVGLLYTAVEIENVLANDYGIREAPVTYDEARGGPCQSPYKTQLLLETHRRFRGQYLTELTGPRLEHLWALSSCLDGSHHDVRWMGQEVGRAHRSPAAAAATAFAEQVGAALRSVATPDGRTDGAALAWCVECCARIEREDRSLVRDLKRCLRTGVRLFERWERDTARRGAQDLVLAARQVPAVLQRYFDRLAELGHDDSSRAPVADRARE